MTEKITINEKDVWIVIEPRAAAHGNAHTIPTEYFIAFYTTQEPGAYTSAHEPGKLPGILFTDDKDEPLLFLSPVAAVEYAVETLPSIVT